MEYMYLKRKGYGNPNNEKKERHNEIGQSTSIPWGVINTWINSTSIIYQYHQLNIDSQNKIKLNN